MLLPETSRKTAAPLPSIARPGGAGRPVLRSPSACSQFVIDSQDCILACRETEAGPFCAAPGTLAGQSLRGLLIRFNPAWSAALNSPLFASEDPLFLPEALPGLGFALHRLRCGDTMSVTLLSEVPPPEELQRAGLGDLSPDPVAFARLFLRLRTTENRLDHILALLPGVLFHQRADLSFAYISPGLENLLGLAAQSLQKDGQALLRLIHEEDEHAYYRDLERNAAAEGPFSLVYRVFNPARQIYLYLLDIRKPVLSPSGLLLGYEGIWLDITRQKLTEHRLATRVWKEGISALSGGLLADFNNVMTGICSLSELYHSTLPSQHPLRDGLGLIRENAAEAQLLVRKIIDLNREPTGEKAYLDLGQVVQEQLDLLQVILPQETQVELPVRNVQWPVFADEMALRQALVHFTLNARDALGRDGRIRISLTRLAPGEFPFTGTTPALEPGETPSVQLVFSDNGSGIAPVHLPHVFEPFFTTKESAQASGLGLYNAKLFAESHEGRVAVRSTLGRGTDLVLILPLADLDVVETSSAPAQPHVLYFEPGMTEESLLLEDIRQRHWDVLTTSTREHAERHLREQGGRLDLLLLRPAGSDPTLASFVADTRKSHPGLRIVLQLEGMPAIDTATWNTWQSRVDLLLRADTPREKAIAALSRTLRTP